MIPFESLYEQICNTPMSLSDVMNRVLIGPYMLAKMQQEMQVINRNLKEAQDRHKSYIDQHRAFKGFHVREHVYLHIKPKRSSLRIGSCANFAPRYCGLLRSLRGLDSWPTNLHCHQQINSMMFSMFHYLRDMSKMLIM